MLAVCFVVCGSWFVGRLLVWLLLFLCCCVMVGWLVVSLLVWFERLLVFLVGRLDCSVVVCLFGRRVCPLCCLWGGWVVGCMCV